MIRDVHFEVYRMCRYIFCTIKYKLQLLSKLEELDQEGMDSFEVTQTGDVFKLAYPFKQSQTDRLEMLTQVVSDIVQKQSIIQITEAYLMKRKDLEIADKKEIKKRFVAHNYLSTQEGFSALTYYLVYRPIQETLEASEVLNIDGWLNFRTHKYDIILTDILDQFVEDYLLKKDIIRFIKMVREMSSLNVPLQDTLHLVYKKDSQMILLNEDMEEVTASYTQEYCQDLLADDTLSEEDLIMNILLTVAPRKIIVHQKQRAKHPQFIKTLESIFGIHMRYCKGCEYCIDHTLFIQG